MYRLGRQDRLDSLSPRRPGEEEEILEEVDALVGQDVARVLEHGEGEETVREKEYNVHPTWDTTIALEKVVQCTFSVVL